MKKGEKENIQQALDYLCKAIRETSNLGIDEYNSILELRLMERKGCKNALGEPLRDCLVVRPIWSRNPERADGYYDICVEGCNCMGVLSSVWKFLDRY